MGFYFSGLERSKASCSVWMSQTHPDVKQPSKNSNNGKLLTPYIKNGEERPIKLKI